MAWTSTTLDTNNSTLIDELFTLAKLTIGSYACNITSANVPRFAQKAVSSYYTDGSKKFLMGYIDKRQTSMGGWLMYDIIYDPVDIATVLPIAVADILNYATINGKVWFFIPTGADWPRIDIKTQIVQDSGFLARATNTGELWEVI